jgi:hypothetical protein
MSWLPDDGFVAVCEVCDGEDLFETSSQPGCEGIRVVACALCESVYEAETGQLLDEGTA